MTELKFDTDAETGRPVAVQLGRFVLGRGEALVRMVLLPDGVHIVLSGADKFVHWSHISEDRLFIDGIGTFVKKSD